MRGLREIAQEMSNNLKYKKREDGTHYYDLEGGVRWMSDICDDAHEDRSPSNDIYEVIEKVLELVSDLDEDDGEDEARDKLLGIEADCYTANLTGWLHDNNSNVYYLTEAIEEWNAKIAQWIWKQEIANDVLSGLVRRQENEEEEEE